MRGMSSGKYASEDLVSRPFKDLKKILDSKKNNVMEGLVRVKGDSSPGDEGIFVDAMKGVQEIREYREMPVYLKDDVNNAEKNPDDRVLNALEEIIEGRIRINLSDTQEYVEWINSGYREDIVNKLHDGKYAVQDRLDLHGYSVDEAETEIEGFLRASIKNGYRCIKIIYGRGLRSQKGPVLKKAVIKWLLSRYRKHMVAFVTARQCDGGLGALYVLLR